MVKNIIQKITDLDREEVYKKIRDTSILHPVRMTGYVLVILFIFALLFCWLVAMLELGKCLWPWSAYLHFYKEWKMVEGLSLMCGYMGVAATVILGVVTLRFSFKVDEREWIKCGRNLRIRKITFFDMYEDFVPHEMRHPGSHKFQFLLKLELETKQSDYKLSVDSVAFGGYNENFEIDKDRFHWLNEYAVYVTEAESTIIWIYFNELGQGENSCSYFYHLWDYEPLAMKKHLWDRCIKMKIQVREVIWIKGQKPRDGIAVVELQVENDSPQKSDEKSIELRLISHTIELPA